jgi:circadian clock protein KaiB
MTQKVEKGTKKEVQKEPAESGGPKYVLRLYVAGASRRSSRAIQNLKKLLNEHGAEQYDVEIIDIYQQPILAKNGQIVAAPTLVKELPPPLQKFIGDLSNSERLIAALNLETREKE